MRHFPVRILIVSAMITAATAQIQAQTLDKSSQGVSVRDWIISQREYGCAVGKLRDDPRSSLPTYWRPFRGPTKIYLVVAPGMFTPVRVGAAKGRLRIEGRPDIPIRASWVVQLDRQMAPEQLAILTLEGNAEQTFRNALASSSVALVDIDGLTVGQVPLAADIWREADQCLARVGDALLTAAPPARRDGSSVARTSPWPRASSLPWIDSDSYSPEALKKKYEGDTRVVLEVDRYGYPSKCHVAQTSGFKILDDRTCSEVLRKAHFHPALDESGSATEGSWESTIRWRAGER